MTETPRRPGAITINGANDVPTVTVPTVGQPGTEVNEAGLPARVVNAINEPAGSAAAGNSEVTTGVITFTNGDGASTVSITVNGTSYVVVGAGAVTNIPGDYGTLHIDSVVGNTINYTYTLADNVDNDTDLTPFETFVVKVEDSDGNPADDASATLTINIIDDVPTAVGDTDFVTEDTKLSASGNVITGVGSDGNAAGGDTVGADGSFVSFVDGTNPGIGTVVPDANGETIQGQYGTLLIASDGSYTYTLYTLGQNATAFNAVQALSAGDSFTETFNYRLTDNDGDTSSANLVITINGANDVPTVTVPTVGQPGTEVNEAGLPARVVNAINEPAGSAAAGNSEVTTGVITFTNGDGASTVSITVNGTSYVVVGAGAVTNIPGDYGTLHIDSVVGNTINYTYTLADNVDNDTDLTPFETFVVKVEDSDGNPADDASATLTINIIDDVPTAVGDTDFVTEDTKLSASGNVITGVGSDGNAAGGDTVGADGSFVSFVDGTNPGIGTVVPDANGETIQGQYGTLLIASDGSYTYTLYTLGQNATAFNAVQALDSGETFAETFNYRLTDNDGDTSSANLVITINGGNDAPTIQPSTATISEEGIATIGNPDSTGNPTDTTNSSSFSGTMVVADVELRAADGDLLGLSDRPDGGRCALGLEWPQQRHHHRHRQRNDADPDDQQQWRIYRDHLRRRHRPSDRPPGECHVVHGDGPGLGRHGDEHRPPDGQCRGRLAAAVHAGSAGVDDRGTAGGHRQPQPAHRRGRPWHARLRFPGQWLWDGEQRHRAQGRIGQQPDRRRSAALPVRGQYRRRLCDHRYQRRRHPRDRHHLERERDVELRRQCRS